MKYKSVIAIFFTLFFAQSTNLLAQNVFSEMELDYNKTLLPYDLSYAMALPDKEFILLSEMKKSAMTMARYDEYFISKWDRTVRFSEDESAPHVFLKGDTIMTCTYTSLPNQLRLTYRYFDKNFGAEAPATDYSFDIENKNGELPKVVFSKNKSKFVVYHQGEGKSISFQIYETGQKTPMEKYTFDKVQLNETMATAVHLSDGGELFFAVADPAGFKLETCYWGRKNSGMKSVSNNFFFERPASNIDKIDIVKQSTSSYFVSFSAKIENELIGFSMSGINVILESVMFSHHQTFRPDEIKSVYENFYVTDARQREKFLMVPNVLDNFRFDRSYVNENHDIILVFEELIKSTDFPPSLVGRDENVMEGNMPWNHELKKNAECFGGDLLMYCFSESGSLKWKKALQKSQITQGNCLSTSFIPRMDVNHLKLMCMESASGGTVYVLDINTLDGSLTKKTDLFPSDKYGLIKRYSCWLTNNAVVVCGVSPSNSNSRKLMLVEF